MPKAVDNRSTIRLGFGELWKSHKSITLVVTAVIAGLSYLFIANFQKIHLKSIDTALGRGITAGVISLLSFGVFLSALHKLGKKTPEALHRLRQKLIAEQQKIAESKSENLSKKTKAEIDYQQALAGNSNDNAQPEVVAAQVAKDAIDDEELELNKKATRIKQQLEAVDNFLEAQKKACEPRRQELHAAPALPQPLSRASSQSSIAFGSDLESEAETEVAEDLESEDIGAAAEKAEALALAARAAASEVDEDEEEAVVETRHRPSPVRESSLHPLRSEVAQQPQRRTGWQKLRGLPPTKVEQAEIDAKAAKEADEKAEAALRKVEKLNARFQKERTNEKLENELDEKRQTYVELKKAAIDLQVQANQSAFAFQLEPLGLNASECHITAEAFAIFNQIRALKGDMPISLGQALRDLSLCEAFDIAKDYHPINLEKAHLDAELLAGYRNDSLTKRHQKVSIKADALYQELLQATAKNQPLAGRPFLERADEEDGEDPMDRARQALEKQLGEEDDAPPVRRWRPATPAHLSPVNSPEDSMDEGIDSPRSPRSPRSPSIAPPALPTDPKALKAFQDWQKVEGEIQLLDKELASNKPADVGSQEQEARQKWQVKVQAEIAMKQRRSDLINQRDFLQEKYEQAEAQAKAAAQRQQEMDDELAEELSDV